MEVEQSKAALKDFKKLSPEIRNRIESKIMHIKKLNDPLVLAKRLVGYENIFRFRVGSYRIITMIEKEKIIVLGIKHRREAYK